MTGAIMTGGVWLLTYDITRSDRDAYVGWFHDCHIPEKLARRGYDWAAHYEAPPHASAPDLFRYIGLFGGTSTRVFLDPSPAQLKPTQTDETRRMMQMRKNPFSAVLAHEWSSQSASGAATRSKAPPTALPTGQLPGCHITAAALQLITINVAENDEAIGSFCAQPLAAFIDDHKAYLRLHKMTNIFGAPRHVVLLESDQEALPASDDALVTAVPPLNDLADTAALASRCAARIWPA